jgi:hypothetical protein
MEAVRAWMLSTVTSAEKAGASMVVISARTDTAV